jgi:hypothetical protein
MEKLKVRSVLDIIYGQVGGNISSQTFLPSSESAPIEPVQQFRLTLRVLRLAAATIAPIACIHPVNTYTKTSDSLLPKLSGFPCEKAQKTKWRRVI